jgi:hypothetical protein
VLGRLQAVDTRDDLKITVLVFGSGNGTDQVISDCRRERIGFAVINEQTNAERCTRLRKLANSMKRGFVVIDGEYRVFSLGALPEADANPQVSSDGSVLLLPPSRQTRRFLRKLAEAAEALPEIGWRALVRAQAIPSKGPDFALSILRGGTISALRVGTVTVVGAVHEEALGTLPAPVDPEALVQWSKESVESGQFGDGAVFLAKGIELGYSAPEAPLELARIYLKANQPRKVPRVLKRYLGSAVARHAGAQSLILSAARQNNDEDGALAACRRLQDIGDPAGVAHARSVLFEMDLDERARRLKCSDEARPLLWWMTGPYPGNFGDILNPYIVEKLTGVPPRRARSGDSSPGRILAIGSVIKFARRGTQVWGTGTPRMTDALDAEADYRAVRGPKTRELVLRSGGQVQELYGDPALLLPLIFSPKVEKKHKLGLIRHYTHANVQLKVEDVREIHILRVGYDDTEEFIRELLSCEHILSTSLHGLIVAHAYGIPTRWCDMGKAGRRISGDGIKFLDHYEALGIECEGPMDLSSFESIDSSCARFCTELPSRPVDAVGLLKAAPFDVQPKFLDAARRMLLPLNLAGSSGKNRAVT